MATPRVLLVHGAATTSRVWDRVRGLLRDDGLEVVAPDRASSGDLAVELAALADDADGAVVVGVSGGATLGLALASDRRIAGAVLHEPAVGSLVPGLLDHVVAGFTSAGVPGFGAALYGPSWTPAMAPADPDAVARDLAMFRRFEPAPLHLGQGRVVVTVGEHSLPARHRAAWALHDLLGVEVRVLPGTGHFVQHDNPQALADAIRSVL
ncbi:alpha/beta fold hydrolase [Cellulomonas humilata]|uniref:Pimeloyl-ACP methyl ester carboxylesterase n=1 Tax=Cellulomonas humilata TaxID=144055 RepID=A0ABU0ECR1_9CELL|nr:alpha/beta fold hydrolase [Cellulomonas humilata]MDQ0373050.1 pimeloyl-ACP methyl ester carboxylesterase [Cellulomonas humilata]